jgi:hypothetical protein
MLYLSSNPFFSAKSLSVNEEAEFQLICKKMKIDIITTYLICLAIQSYRLIVRDNFDTEKYLNCLVNYTLT